MIKLLQFAKVYKNFILYIVFGVITTLINWVTYFVCAEILNISNVVATIIAWFVAVAFAFITNKIWVFESKSFSIKCITKEIPSFLLARFATGVLDVAIMWIFVDLLNSNAYIWKMISNIVVIILNYGLSKLIVFKK